MSIFDEPKIDCHNHVFDPERFPCQKGHFYLPAGQEPGTPVPGWPIEDAIDTLITIESLFQSARTSAWRSLPKP